jgi:hypothetical protein
MSMLGQDSSPYSFAALHDGHTACIRDPLGTCYFFQGGDLDIIQGARLREETGEKLGYHTGGETVRRNRVQAGTFHRE